MIENIFIEYIDQVVLIVAVAYFFFKMNASIDRLNDNIDNLRSDIKEMSRLNSEEHGKLIDTLHGMNTELVKHIAEQHVMTREKK